LTSQGRDPVSAKKTPKAAALRLISLVYILLMGFSGMRLCNHIIMDNGNVLHQMQSPQRHVKLPPFIPRNIYKISKLLILFAAIFLFAAVVGTTGYLLGARSKQPMSLSRPMHQLLQILMTTYTPSPTILLIHPGRDANLSNPEENTEDDQANWRIYKSEFKYQYSYPSTWHHSPEVNAPLSLVSAPGAKYPDGYFTVDRKSAEECDGYQKFLSELNPTMKQKQIMISGYLAFQLEGKSILGDGYAYDRKSVLIVNKDTCFHLDITSKDNPEQLNILNKILSSFNLLE
jgi:hypothetical protein